jgi:CrcB protein
VRTARTLLAVLAGGAAGGLARTLLVTHEGPGAPWLTWAINVVGAFALGFLLAAWVRPGHAPTWVRPLLGTGLLGGFTTFSAVTHAVDRLVADGDAVLAAGYLVATLVVGALAAFAGLGVGARVAAPAARGGAR